MRARVRILASLAAGFAVGLGVMAHDRARDAQWAVTAAQIADAQAHGKAGVEIAPGRLATQPIPSGDAALLPVKWLLSGVGAACAVLVGTGRRISLR